MNTENKITMETQNTTTTVPAKLLLMALENFRGLVGKNRTIPICEGVKFSPDGLTGTDLETFCFVPFPFKGIETGFVLDYKELMANLKGLSGLVSIEVNGDKVKFNAGSISIKMNTLAPVDEFPKMPEISVKHRFVCPALSEYAGFCSTDDLRPALNAVCLSKLGIAATDAHLIKWTKSVQEFLIPDFEGVNIPSGMAVRIKEACTCEVGMERTMFTFPNGARWVCRNVMEKFPDYPNVIPENNPIQAEFNRMELIEAIKQVMPAANKTTQQLRLMFGQDELNIFAEDIDLGKEAQTNVQGVINEEIEIGFNGKFLLKLLTSIKAANITLEMSTPNRAALIKVDGGKTIYLIMPQMLSTYA